MHRTALLWAHAAALQQPFRAAPRRAVPARARFETGDDVPGGTYETYVHDGWTCGYRHKTGCEPAIVLLHPVGIGLSSWFWTRVMAELPNEVYAPDFIGCGRSDAPLACGGSPLCGGVPELGHHQRSSDAPPPSSGPSRSSCNTAPAPHAGDLLFAALRAG